MRKVMGVTLSSDPKVKPRVVPWRTSKQIQGVASVLKRDINCCTDGAYVMIDWKTARNLLEICAQAKHTEED
jgi:hypothetical protein